MSSNPSTSTLPRPLREVAPPRPRTSGAFGDAPRWGDLASRPAGLGVAHESARRTAAGGPAAGRTYLVGADGERHVAQLLRTVARPSPLRWLLGMPPPWRVLHSVPFGARDIDHLVIGRCGIVTINTRHHRGGRIRVDGDTVVIDEWHGDWVRAARAEAAAVNVRLRTELLRAGRADLARQLVVHPMITVVGGVLQVGRWPAGVNLTTGTTLVHTLNALPAVLRPSEAEEVYAVARWERSWCER